jgi:hypothetical protein
LLKLKRKRSLSGELKNYTETKKENLPRVVSMTLLWALGKMMKDGSSACTPRVPQHPLLQASLRTITKITIFECPSLGYLEFKHILKKKSISKLNP